MEKLKKLLASLKDALEAAEELVNAGEHHLMPVYRALQTSERAVAQRMHQTETYKVEQQALEEQQQASLAELKPKTKDELLKVVQALNQSPARNTLIAVEPLDTRDTLIKKIMTSGLYRPTVKAEKAKAEDSNQVLARLMGYTVEKLNGIVVEMNKAEDRAGDLVIQPEAKKLDIALAIIQAMGMPAPQQQQQP
jgi:hypothetical protein